MPRNITWDELQGLCVCASGQVPRNADEGLGLLAQYTPLQQSVIEVAQRLLENDPATLFLTATRLGLKPRPWLRSNPNQKIASVVEKYFELRRKRQV